MRSVRFFGGIKIKFTDNSHSKVVSIRRIIAAVKYIGATLTADMVPVFSAQACFYIILSAVPTLMLTVSVLQLFIPQSVQDMAHAMIALLPDKFSSPLEGIVSDVFSRPGISLLSVSAVFALWSVSRAVTSVGSGVRKIYGAPQTQFTVGGIIASMFCALILILLICTCLLLFIFGGYIASWLTDTLDLFGSDAQELFIFIAMFILFLLLTLVFTVLFAANANKTGVGSTVTRTFSANFPGAVLAAAGWFIYSFGYNIYLKYFAFGASVIYGSLSAAVMLMFWMYFCINILLYGAEVNLLIKRYKNRRR